MSQAAETRIKTLHYFFDPLCGWCYAVAPLIDAASRVPKLVLEMHAGGLWPEAVSPTPEMRGRIRSADARVAQLTGQRYGSAYLDGWLADPTTVLESRPPTAAWLAVCAVAPEQGLAMLQVIHKAHYEDGRRVVEHEVLADLAASIGIDRARYETALATVAVDAHIADTRRRMAELGVNGFPALFLSRGDGLVPVPAQAYLGRPDAFVEVLQD